MKATVYGAGRQGTAIAYAMGKLGFELELVDPNRNALQQASEKLLRLGQTVRTVVTGVPEEYAESWGHGSDVLISSAPYYANESVASFCIQNEINYCDLGGQPAVSRAIRDLATDKSAVFPDLGLAPGLVNILGTHLCKLDPEAERVEMMVGGLPKHPTGLLKYARTWSTAGLRGEYTGTDTILLNGQEVEVEAMDGLAEALVMVGNATLECFYTRGGMGLSLDWFKERGLKNVCYKTLRYHGHCDLIKFLFNECQLQGEEFDKVIERACPVTTEDLVVVYVDTYGHEVVIRIDSDEHWTAMQMGTAFPIAAVAAILAEGKLKGYLNYSDVPFEKFQENLEVIGFPEIKIFDKQWN